MTTQQQITDYINTEIAAISYPATPAGLYEPIAYTMSSGGKRLRPTLLLSAMEAFGGEIKDAVNQAIGIEMYHNFTLVHDDVMDNADVRRGRPTVTHKWGRDTAILSGDTILSLATVYMAKCAPDRLSAVLEMFNRTAIEVYEGQQFDMDFESRMDVSIDEYINMIRLKTSVLLAGACAIGAIMAGATEAEQKAMYEYGISLGLAFQLRDDYLDTYGDPLIFGKEIGGDIVNGKKTWLLINALNSDSTGELKHILATPMPDSEKIERVRNIYNGLGLDKSICSLIEEYTDKAVNALNGINLKPGWKEYFSELATGLNKRDL